MEKLYRKDNNGKPTVWWAEPIDDFTISVHYGRVGGVITEEIYSIDKKNIDIEVISRYNEKRKKGYLGITEIKDDSVGSSPVEDKDLSSPLLLAYLTKYLKDNRTNTNNGALLPMLAKTYDGKFFSKVPLGIGQWKINGLRCFISAYQSDDIFNSIRLKFQSREGIYWNTLNDLEDYLLVMIPQEFLKRMIDENIILDGELYLPGYSVNQINHFVKDATCYENKLIQFWCYDLAMENANQGNRIGILEDNFYEYRFTCNNISKHLNNTNRIVLLDTYHVHNNDEAIKYRNEFIKLGFEGLILRNPKSEYEFGRRRVKVMEKFKLGTDGIFIIKDIYQERKRHLPIILCYNDINDEVFKTKFSLPVDEQAMILANKLKYIGRKVFITFGERSGVNKVPSHITEVKLID